MEIGIVTGASSGLGWQFAIQIDQKYNLDEIWIIGRRENRLLDLAKQLKSIKPIVLKCDLINQSDVNNIQKRLEQSHPNIKMLVNNAGFGKSGYFHNVSLEKQVDMVNLNINAVLKLTHMCIPYMKPNSKIINVASTAGFVPMPRMAVYAATKAFLVSFSTALSIELKQKGINVISVCPGPVDTEFFSISREAEGKPPPYITVKPQGVVRKALIQANRKRLFSIYGIIFKLTAYFVPRFFSKKLIAKMVDKLWP